MSWFRSPLFQLWCLLCFPSHFHTIIKSFRLEWTFKGHPTQLPCNEQGHLQFDQMLRAPSSRTSSVSRDKESSTSLNNRSFFIKIFFDRKTNWVLKYFQLLVQLIFFQFLCPKELKDFCFFPCCSEYLLSSSLASLYR